MSEELLNLTCVTILTALLWIPYALNRIKVLGLVNVVSYPSDPAPMAPWAERLKAAHYNAIENLVVFAALVLIAHLAGISNDQTVLATSVYFWARVIHPVAYALAIPWVRTLAFAVGFFCQVTIALQLL